MRVSSYFCGSAGCVPRIYARANGGWREIPLDWDTFINGAPEMWSVADDVVAEHAVLVMTEDNVTARFVWTGEGYASED